MAKRACASGLATAIFAFLLRSPAAGETDVGQTADGATVVVGRGEREAPRGSRGGGSGGSVPCQDYGVLLAQLGPGLSAFLGGPVRTNATGRMAWTLCGDEVLDGGSTGRFTGYLPPAPAAAATPTPGTMAAIAAAQLRIPVPAVATAPPAGGLQLAGVRVWFWATNGDTLRATASIPGLSATVTATPVDLTIDTRTDSNADTGTGTGTGTGKATCSGSGPPFDAARSDRTGNGACTYVFQTRGNHTVAVTARWSMAWAASDGSTGTLPDLVRTTSLMLPVSDAQAVTD